MNLINYIILTAVFSVFCIGGFGFLHNQQNRGVIRIIDAGRIGSIIKAYE